MLDELLTTPERDDMIITQIMTNSPDNSSQSRNSLSSVAVGAVRKILTLDTYAAPLRKQFTRRSLIGFLLYLVIGLCYYHIHQRYSVLDAVYFSITTLITIGYGDLKPGSTNERIFTALYVIFGIFILSAAVTAVSTAIYGRYNAAVEERFARMALRMREERIRHSDSIDIDTHIETTTNYGSNVDKEHRSMQQDHILKFLDMNEHSRIDGAESEQEAASLSFRQRVLSKVDGITATIIPPISKNLQHQRDKEVLETLQALNLSIFDEDLQEMRVNIIRTFGLIVLVMLIGWISMLLIEDWNFGDSFYWSVVTITTVGFGDIVPNSDGGKVFTIFYGLVGCAVLAHGMNTLVAYPLTKKSKQSELRVMMQFGGELTEMTLQEIMCNDLFERIPNLRNDKNSISRSEFILLMLSLMNKTYEKDLMIISSIFDVLDKNKIGVLSADALIQQKAH